MGFSDVDVELLEANGISKTQIYKMAGNSIPVKMLEHLFTAIYNTEATPDRKTVLRRKSLALDGGNIMRVILFRGKHKGEWLYGDFIHHYGTQGDSIFCYKGEDNRRYIYAVEAKTVGQYTGLSDMNGKKIFEGDIVRYGDTIHNVVFEQRNATAYFGLVYSACETLPFGHYQDLKSIEVIGNIHDNPELLED